VIEIVLALIYIGLLVASAWLARSVAVFSALVFIVASFLGALIQVISVDIRSVTLGESQVWLLAGLTLVFVGALLSRRRHPPGHRAFWIIGGSSAVIAAVFIVTRLLAPGQPEILSSVGYLITRPGGEDNAKWLNATSQLAQGTPLDTWASVGGPLVLVFTLCATLMGAASFLLYGGVNEVAVAAGTVLLAEHLMVVIAPFALAPLVGAGKRLGVIRRVPTPVALLAIVILVATVAWPLEFGHVTLQYTILAFTLWIGLFLAPQSSPLLRALVTLGIALTAMVWFPIGPVAVIVLLAVVAWSLRARQWPVLIASIVTVGLLAEFLTSALRFSLGIPSASGAPARIGGGGGGVAASDGVLPLFDSPGGTAIASTMILILTAVTAIGAVAFFVRRGLGAHAILVRFAPIVLLAGYAWFITIVDFWAVGGGPNYASLKVVYATVMPILATTVVLALLVIDQPATGMTPLRWVSVASILVILTIDPFISRIAAQIRPALWPSTSDFPYWAPAEVRPTGDQPLTSNPIACIYLPPDAEKPSALPDGGRAYACSRLLAGLAGAGTEANAIVQWQLKEWINNANLWDSEYPFFTLMDPEIRGRTVILLDRDERVIGIESFERLVTRYAPTGP
jgi:hypothetical protein